MGATKGAAGAITGGGAGALKGGGILKWLGLGKGAAATTGATQLTIPGLTGAGGAGGTAGTIGGVSFGVAASIALGAMAAFSAIGEGGGQLLKIGKGWEDNARKKAEEHVDVKAIATEIGQLRLVVEFLEKTEKTLSSITFDIKNLIEIIKIETQ